MNFKGGKVTLPKNFSTRVKFAFHVLSHPIRGFYELKYEKEGSLSLGLMILFGVFVTSVIRSTMTGYLFNQDYGTPINIFVIFAKTVFPFLLWSIASWCLTVLFSGEGTMKEIFTAVSYATLPLIFSNVLLTLLTNVLINKESMYITFFDTFFWIWTFALIFIAMMGTHQYTFLKNIIVSILTIFGIAVIIFIILLGFQLIQQIYTFVYSVYKELSFRYI